MVARKKKLNGEKEKHANKQKQNPKMTAKRNLVKAIAGKFVLEHETMNQD